MPSQLCITQSLQLYPSYNVALFLLAFGKVRASYIFRVCRVRRHANEEPEGRHHTHRESDRTDQSGRGNLRKGWYQPEKNNADFPFIMA